ncbi:unnamed protein product [Allacma fusca]|uniref:Transcription initiation factor IIB n=1 Tax=Allacma fusca TaxID=39272 RepID=A0A8J2J4W8_9HEXA|nr:unnamed protein product [Allacma fusca]
MNKCRAIDVGSESQPVGTGRVPGDASRLGEAENPRSSASVDRILANAFNRISTIADRDVHEQQMLKPRSKDAIATASLHLACHQENIPRTFKEICEAAQKSKKEVRRGCKIIRSVSNIWIEPITVEYFMPRFCTKLELPPEIQNAAAEIARNAVEMDLVPGRFAISVTAAAIYMASKASSTQKTKKEIAEVAGVAAATVSQAYKLMKPRAEELFPRDFDFGSH